MKRNNLVVSLLLMLQAVSALYMWTITILGTLSAEGYAIFLAIDLLSFAMVADIYTHEKWEGAINPAWIIIGAIGLIILLVSSLYFT